MNLANSKELFENEFETKFRPITITPNFSSQKIESFFQSLGPFNIQVPIKVPLYVALELSRTKRCNIVLPQCLEMNHLSFRLDEEKQNKETLTKLDPDFFNLVKIFLKEQPSLFEDISAVHSIVDTLEKIRHYKIMNMIKTHQAFPIAMRLDNITRNEVVRIKPYILEYMKNYTEIKHKFMS
eukprot:GAHX01000602.1.p1 GENE.GAHX01000602.1~~GAHX01000602.1.p1  ORF type:complete len:182 (+),score=27.14 GAHX01000602.1:98-643(+)